MSETAGALAAAVRFAREACGAERCSLVVRRAAGGSELFANDATGDERRALSIVPTQLFEHFDAHPAAEIRGSLGASSFDSDRSLAKKGYGEVVRAPLRDGRGRTIGMLNVIRARPESTERDRAFVERLAHALVPLVEAGE
jgi:hypothetical protein